MGFLIAFAARAVGARFAPLLVYGGLALIAAIIVWRLVDSYGDRRADDREAEVRAEYKAASDRLKAEAALSATRADDAAAVRFEQHVAQVQQEQEELDEAQRNGSSPLDVLFGG